MTNPHRTSRLIMAAFALAAVATSSEATKDSLDDRLRRAFGKDYARPDEVPYAEDNAYTPAKAELGRVLFFDQRLSKSGAQSCASCHHPGLGWEMGVAKAVGAQVMPRKSQTLLNLAWADTWFWDGRADSYRTQFHAALTSAKALAMSPEDLEKRIGAIPGYAPLFKAAFSDQRVSEVNIGLALEIYQRGIRSGPAPFDRWQAGDVRALSDEAKRGALLFAGKANCVACHSGWNFSDGGFHDVGLTDEDLGRGKVVPLPAMAHAFKTPGLRSIAQRAPYMHDGSIPDLAGVVDHYDGGGRARRPSLSRELKPLHLTKSEKRQLIEFLRSLTGDDAPVTIPQMPM